MSQKCGMHPRGVISIWALAAWLSLASSAAMGESEPMPLVQLDGQYAEWLSEADRAMARGDVAEALRAYQALIVTGGKAVGSDGDRRFTTVSRIATARIGALSAERLRRYRSMYDGPAGRLFRQARDDMDRKALRRVVAHYFHTSYGDQALIFLGSVQFDRAQTVQAARSFQRVLDRRTPLSVRRDVTLARAAVAWHRAGVASMRAKHLAELRTDYAESEAMLAGTAQNISAFAQAACEQATSQPATGEVRSLTDRWPGLGGLGDGLVVMADSEASLDRQWQWPATPSAVLATGEVKQILARLGEVDDQPEIELKGGHVRPKRSASESRRRSRRSLAGAAFALPPVTHPVVAAGMLIARTGDGVIAWDLACGAEQWRAGDLPMIRSRSQQVRIHWVGLASDALAMADDGRYGLTVGGDRVFLVGRFARSGLRHRLMRIGGGSDPPSTGSELTALSLSGGGTKLWTIGVGAGSDPLLAAGTFLGPPTCDGDRLYVTIMHQETYYLACLNAADGALVWKAAVGQARMGTVAAERLRTMGGHDPSNPPAVADGRVYMTTNAGLIAAFEADTGESVWTYQYADGRDRRGGRLATSAPRPGNPLVIIDGVLIALPADSEHVVALDCADGQLVFRADRHSQTVLSAMDRTRLVLTNPGLVVIDTARGEQIYRYRLNARISGRPAVGPTMIMASGDGRLIRARLGPDKRFTVERMRLTDRKAILGNLVSLPGRLIAGGVGAVCVYMAFDDVYRDLTDRIEHAGEAGRGSLRLGRARLLLAAGRVDEAIADIRAAEAYARSAADADLLSGVQWAFCRAYIHLGDHAADPRQMGHWYALALRHAPTDAQIGQMLVRMIRYHEREGRLTEAVSYAIRLIEECGQADLRDVQIGPSSLDVSALPIESGRLIALRHVQRLIDTGGPSVYAQIDAAVKRRMDEAHAAGDVDRLVLLQENHPHSQWGDRILLTAAETAYLKAIDAEPVDANGLRQAGRILLRLPDYRQSPLLMSGRAGEALIQLRLNPAVAKIVYGRMFAEAAADEAVAFGDYDGDVAGLRKLIASGRPPRRRDDGESMTGPSSVRDR